MFQLIRSVSAQVCARIHDRFDGTNNLFSIASDVTELCPEEIIDGKPIKALAGQIERVEKSPFGSSSTDVIAKALGGMEQRQSTNIYHFTDVTVANRWVICKSRHEEFCWPQSEWAFSNPVCIPRAAFADSVQGSRFFGHWLRDDCATNLILPDNMLLMRPARQQWSDEEFYSDLLDLKPAAAFKHARIKELTYIDDLANNSHKLARLQQHRATIRQKIKQDRPNDIVYISRGASARGRMIDNEVDLADALRSRGVNVIASESLESPQFFQQILDANLIISAEGSQCAHAIYALKEGAAGMITLQPHDRFWLPHLEWTRLFGFDFGVVVSDPRRGGFWIDPAEVLRTIDLF